MTSPSHEPSWQRPASASLVDPEDDLPSATYAGDFETTKIPPYSASGGVNVLNDPEPLPYVQHNPYAQPEMGHTPAVGPAEIEPDDAKRADGRRGTQDLGLLLLRVGFGALLIVHGLQKVFGWWGGSGLGDFHDSITELGYQHANILTYAAAGTQIAAGVLLVLGLFTPLAAAAALAYLINVLLAGVVTQDNPRQLAFFLPDGHEYTLTLIVVAAAIILIGPGRYGFDAGRGWARRPFVGSFVALLLGVGGGIAVWVLLNAAHPLF